MMAKTVTTPSLTTLVPKGKAHRVIGRRERAAQRRLRCMELRKAGYTYNQIVDIMRGEGFEKYSVGTVCTDIRSVMQEIVKNQMAAGEDVRQMEVERLDAMLEKHWVAFHGIKDPDSETGEYLTRPDLTQSAAIIRIMDRRARLLGLDAPDTSFMGLQITQETVHRNLIETQNIIESPAANRRMSEILLALGAPKS